MSGRVEAKKTPCRFCRDMFTSSGLFNHERWCDENPHTGVHPDNASDLLDGETAGADPSPDADPDQRVTKADGSGLPSRDTLPSGDKGTRPITNDEGCPGCGSTDTMPSHEARQRYADEMDGLPAGLRSTFDAAETYCNNCYSVSGDELGEPYCIPEGFA